MPDKAAEKPLPDEAAEEPLGATPVGEAEDDGPNQLAVFLCLQGTDGPMLFGLNLSISGWRSPPTSDQFAAYQEALPKGLRDEGWEDGLWSSSAGSRTQLD